VTTSGTTRAKSGLFVYIQESGVYKEKSYNKETVLLEWSVN
jgi:hypothetical protein